jgi:energy-coupling factor transport system ATP-binding protein
MEPQVLILDEPTAGLDPRGREEVLALVTSIHESRQCTVIMVSHSMDEVARVAGRVIVMSRAEIAIDGTPREVFKRSAELREMGLDIPAVAQLCGELMQRGLSVPAGIMTLQELKAWLIGRIGGAA